MVFAFAALILHLGSGFQAMPAAAAPAAVPAPAPAPTADLPMAPLPSKPNPSASAASGDSVQPSGVRGSQPVHLLASTSLDPNNTQSLSTIRVPEQPQKQTFIAPESPASRRKWLALSVAEHSAATFDAYSTRQAVQSGATEADPFMRPFVHSPGIYAAIQVAPLALDYTARHMQRSEFGLFRRTWWVPQSVATGIFMFSGVHNLNVANSR